MHSRSIVIAFVLAALSSGCDQINARRRVQEGNRLHGDDKPAEAVAKYEEALKLAPDLALGWYNLGIAHADQYKAGDKAPENEAHATAAIDALVKYMTLQPDDEAARKLLLGLYTKSGRWDGALDYFKSQVDKNPKDTFSLAQLADLNKQAKRWDDAHKWYLALAEAQPKDDQKADAWAELGASYYSQLKDPTITGDDRVRLADEGLAALHRSVELNPRSSRTYSFINQLYRQRSAGQKSYVAIVDAVTADQARKRAVELKNSAAAATPTPQPPTPPKKP
jgi:tetratricopeptide (TPR) repeat protein